MNSSGTRARVFAVVVTGPPGAGKTSVLTALTDALADDDVAHAAVEAEALRWAHPGLSDEQEMRHVAAMCASFRDIGHRRLLVGQTIETDADLARLVAVVGADEYFVVRLEATSTTLVERVIAREPETWSGLAALVEHTQELAATMPALHGIDLVLSTEGQRPEDVAQRIRAARPEQLLAQPPGTSS